MPVSGGSAPVVAITPIQIEPGSNTGTAVSASIATMRAQVQQLNDHVGANAAHLAELRNAGADSAFAYHESKARITTRLQVGTTRGNPELVSEWNNAQSSLDSLAGNINCAECAGRVDRVGFLVGALRARPDPGDLQRVGRGR